MFTIEKTALLVVDVQGKLASLMHEKEKILNNIQALIKAAQIFKIPIVWTEQVPEKIGRTVPEIAGLLKDSQPIEKMSFSCCPNKKFISTLESLDRKQIIVSGIETHVCVYQTVYDLIDLGFKVQAVTDAISSRTPENKEAGLERIKEGGATLTCTEMIVCELLRSAEHPNFKEVLALIK